MNRFKQLISNLKGRLQVVERELLNSVARMTGFVQRSSAKLSGWDFFQLMTSEHFNDAAISLQGLCDVLRTLNPAADLSAQALHQKMNSQQAVSFMEEIFTVVYKKHLTPLINKVSQSVFSDFNRVFLQDSTQIELHRYLSDDFRGSGGAASKAAMKIDLLYELKQSIVERLTISGGTVSDQNRADLVLADLEKGDLVIRDLGYFMIDVFRKIAERGAYFLSRYKHHTTVYTDAGTEREPVNLLELIRKTMTNGMADMTLFLGKQRFPCRMVAYRAPQEVAEARRRKIKKEAQKRGRGVDKEYLALQEYSIYITNVPSTLWSGEIIGTVYRIRWQIELVFKQWKQLFRIHVMRGSRPERIRCLIYGRLIMILMATAIVGFASVYAHDRLGRETSAVKLIQWLKRKERLSTALQSNTFDRLLDELMQDIPKLLLKQKRFRQTTAEMLQEKVPFLASFQNLRSTYES